MKLIIRNDKTYRQGKAKLLFSTFQNKGYRMPLNMKFRIESLAARCWFKCMIVERRLVRSAARKASYVWHAAMNQTLRLKTVRQQWRSSSARKLPTSGRALLESDSDCMAAASHLWCNVVNTLVLQRLQTPGQTKCPAQEVQTVRTQRTVWPVQQPFPVGCKPRDVRAARACGQSR